MQHAIINAMECMRAIKGRIYRPVYQLAIISIEPLYHAQQVSRWKSSVRDLQDPSAHHSSVVFRHDKIKSAVIITSLIAMFTLKAVKSAQFVPSTADSTSTDSYKGTLETTRDAHPETQTSRRTNELLCTRTQQLRTSSPTLIQGFKWVAIEIATHKDSSATKITQNNGGKQRQSTEKSHGEQ
ncbi:putative LRR receptor-like serine/threonine-protein kinase [Dorcoceras hygrometricum]|uniref:Putative LRR receptor-like serine/threonine-protein kinase n=1 Tax=Dorcoceras hygrometricum TaxID=472368 RepID=A0A2Z7AFW1_9LAMI|nr:putative LRR receptor-like serine/threonine-protein kinase [Dorcoceras hygrometricum]